MANEAAPFGYVGPTEYMALDEIVKCLNCGAWCIDNAIAMRKPSGATNTGQLYASKSVIVKHICGSCAPKLAGRFAALAGFGRGTTWRHGEQTGAIE